MPLFTIRDTIPCHVTFLYQVQAESEDEARELFKESQSGYVGHEVGETIAFLDTACLEIEVGDTVQAETRQQGAASDLLKVCETLARRLPELDDDTPLSGSDAVEVLADVWPHLKAAVANATGRQP